MAQERDSPRFPRTDEPAGLVRSRSLDPGRARDLLRAVEQLGVDSSLVTVMTAPARGQAEVGRVDQAALTRPARRVALGAVAGAVLAAILGLVAVAIGDFEPAPVLVLALLVGAILGGLWSLYGRLLANVEASDTDTGGPSVVEVAVETLDPATVDQVRRVVREARP
jgi:hypothetical protein